MEALQQSEPFDLLQDRYLGKYVYVLIDPQDQSIFYVGQGLKERVGSHFNETRDAIRGLIKWTPKTRRIYQIWNTGLEVRVAIVRKKLRDSDEASHIEGALIQTITNIGFELTNEVQAPKTENHGWSELYQIRREAASPINPSHPINLVHLFKVENEVNRRVKSGGSAADPNLLFEALRRSWYGRKSAPPPCGYAVGYVGVPAVSVIACKIAAWQRCSVNHGKWEMIREEPDDKIVTELLEKNWSLIIRARGGAKSFGSPAQLEFDGAGRFKFLYGRNDGGLYHSLDVERGD
ncbi:LEM-3-like GIY-YIG domain-containing protein [Hyphococcus sp. DH-69]|uniref:LEM-3-like GIY-YIG domain-containing protein n=1 Tax=Hyphococcus formosus TaxID=3143534 RepID=UPI00398A7755